MNLRPLLYLCLLVSGPNIAISANLMSIAQTMKNPKNYPNHDLIVLGNATLETANLVFLPEIHDDPDSLTFQLVMLAQEKLKKKPFMILDESLTSLQKSPWDIFSQKSLEILAAQKMRASGQIYTPRKFEAELKNLADKHRAAPGPEALYKNQGLWTLSPFQNYVTPFFGWDTKERGQSLLTRNIDMVSSLDKALKSYDRLIVMAGARHIPELEYYTSQQILCSHQKFPTMHEYFAAINEKFGAKPNLTSGLGSSMPVYDFVAKKRYVVVFKKSLYNQLDKVVTQFKSKLDNNACLVLQRK